ncbi:MAG: fatty acid desaturase family protein [Acidimicrobiales bacterium]
MAVSDIQAFAHLTDEQMETFGRELDELRERIESSLGDDDAAYIRRVIKWHRALAAGGRVTLFASGFPPAWVLGTALLATAKILENMEIGHNVMHGQWDWMNDPEIHSTTWEWDNVCSADQWRHSHNFIHHQFTNVLGKDWDIGYGILRVSPDQRWNPAYLGQPVYNLLLALLFEWGVGVHDIQGSILMEREDLKATKTKLGQFGRKIGRQLTKDYVVYPALSGPNWLSTITANFTANIIRNVWSYVIIFCNHFPDGVQRFTEEELEGETRPAWYLRQLHGAANFTGSRALHILSGSLGYQIEHHLYPDLPSNRFPEISVKVRELCERFDLPYTTGPLYRQYGQVLRTIFRLALPDRKSAAPPADGEVLPAAA